MPVGHGQRLGIRETEVRVDRYEDSAGLIVPLEGLGQHNPTRWEGALLQLTEFNAVEAVLIAPGLETR
jgi:hypothetical protein